jgi:hypothetical protein
MIDYDKIDDDPIVAEVRRAREALAAEYGFDLRAIFEAFQQREATSNRTYANLQPRPLPPEPAETRKVG